MNNQEGGPQSQPKTAEQQITLGERIRMLRKVHSLTQGELAKKSGVSAGSIGRVETEPRAFLRPEAIEKIARAFDLSVVDFLSGVLMRMGAQRRRLKQETLQEIHVSKILITESVSSTPEAEIDGKPTEESFEVHIFSTVPAKVGMEAGASIQISEDEWRRVTVYIEMPCYRERLEKTQQQVQDTVDKLLRDRRNRMIIESAQSYYGTRAEEKIQ